ncbi:Hypothetical protein CAP_4742 [Chondromyces apiculatus DSM 436]|uniref:Lanthionine biosynthesis cyclase LanC n=2 Tax=Chondromyces apiculatus TaxID=51 RepID=A0A017T645_9BACT|nr:Hypothetical protein CAP_4742 [Chondromyces apiculatus DSM 436]
MAAALFDPARHQPLAASPWDPAAARAAIDRIVADARLAFTPDGLWPIHPDDAEDDEPGPHAQLYFGAAGVVWALDHLVREGAADPGPTFAEHLPDILARNRQTLETEAWRTLMGEGWQTRSWLLGDAGILFTSWKTGVEPRLDDLAATIAGNTDDPSRELMWGAPGTMLAALALHRATGEARWAALYRAGARALAASFEADDDLGVHLWTQNLYGQEVRYLGAVHGFAGNAFALNEGRDLLDPDEWRVLSARIARTLEAFAIRGPEGMNFPAVTNPKRPDAPLLVQHCHGAPGMVTALAGLDAPIDDLLLGAGELTWVSGPLAKGGNLCHGTAGNAFAFLKLFARTADALWLDRARAFAMHAIAQSEADAARLGRRRYALWTGDVGVACFLWECLHARARFPTMDVL